MCWYNNGLECCVYCFVAADFALQNESTKIWNAENSKRDAYEELGLYRTTGCIQCFTNVVCVMCIIQKRIKSWMHALKIVWLCWYCQIFKRFLLSLKFSINVISIHSHILLCTSTHPSFNWNNRVKQIPALFRLACAVSWSSIDFICLRKTFQFLFNNWCIFHTHTHTHIYYTLVRRCYAAP